MHPFWFNGNYKGVNSVKFVDGPSENKGLGSRRGEIGPAIEMHTDLKYVYMVYFIEKNRNFICLVLKL